MDAYDEYGAFPDQRVSPEEMRKQSAAIEEECFPIRLLDAIPSMFLLLNETRQIVFVNRVFIETFGMTDKESVSGLRPGEALRCVYSDKSPDGCGASEFCAQCGANAAIRTSLSGTEKVRECNLLRKNDKGEVEALDLLVWAYPFPFGGETYSAFSLVDISHEKRRRALERLFFHDILNVAGGIQTYTEFLGHAGGRAGAEELAVINKYARKLVEEIQTQRELAMAESNELIASLIEFNVRDFLADTVSIYREHEAARDRVISIAPDIANVPMTSDPVLLGRVLGNMLKNALEASGYEETITVCGAVDGDWVEFSIHNNGVVSPDARKNIFKRSFSTKGQGRGLGTYSMRLIGERHLGGAVSFTSSEEEGTTFRIRLPRRLKPRKLAQVPPPFVP